MRLLTPVDQPAIEKLCGQQPEYNIFFLANLDQLSSQRDLVRYWGQFDEAGHLVGVMMRYHVLWYVYDTPHTNLTAFAQRIKLESQGSIIVNDNVRFAPGLVPLLRGYRVELDITARLRRSCQEHVDRPAIPCAVHQATLDDVERLAQFYSQAPEDVRRGRASVRRSIGNGRRTFLAEVDDEIVAGALTTAELPALAMVGGLHTPEHLREQEYLLAAFAGLVSSLLDEGKRVCVVSRDPLVDAICDRLDFEDVGTWRIVHLKLGRSEG